MRKTVAELLDEAARAPVTGWDFTWAAERTAVSPPPWDFGALAQDALQAAASALDMGTGGGEFLAGFPVLPARMVATESWAPNVPVAGQRLARRGVAVIHSEGAVDNAVQGADPAGRLPFRSAAFDLVLNRHEAFAATEVARVLAPGGRFLTQQAGTGSDQFHALLGLRAPRRPAFDLDLLLGQAVCAGLTVEDARVGWETTRFADVGALAWYLRMVPWAVPGFDVTVHRQALEAVAARDLVVYQERLLLVGRRG
ncbi:MAG TPA: methyltransferase domain-containing protein [Trebonia sp.]